MIQSRSELHELMGKTINSNLQSLNERGEYAEYAVKTNIIEANCKIDEIPRKFSNYEIEEIKTTHDKFLYVLIVRYKDERLTLYVDTIQGRFWKVYSIEESIALKNFIEQFTNTLLNIDSLWMPHQMIDNIESNYTNVGFSIKFKQEVLTEEQLSEDEISQLTMRLWSNGSKPALELVKILNEKNYPVTKTSTRLLNKQGDEVRFLDEVFYDGKITVSKGMGIEDHIQLVDNIIGIYREKMDMIEEDQMSLELTKGGLKANGYPFEIKFSRAQNVNILAERLISPIKPFRTWGLIHNAEDEFLRIAGVDTHTGDKFDLDIMPDYARLYLPKGACGNLIFRLYTNIQHSLDPGVKISDEHGLVF